MALIAIDNNIEDQVFVSESFLRHDLIDLEFPLDCLDYLLSQSKHDAASGSEIDMLHPAIVDPAALAVGVGFAALRVDVQESDVSSTLVGDGSGEVLAGHGRLKSPIGKGLPGAEVQEFAQCQVMVSFEI